MMSDAPGNEPIEPPDLPAATDVEYQPVSGRYHRVLLVHILVFVVVAVAASLVLRLSVAHDLPFWLHPRFVGPAAVIALVGAGLWARAYVRRMGYAVRERDIFYRRGVVWRSVTAVPFSRVQHVETHHGPLDRRFGLAALKVYTAGATRADLHIPGLPAGDADRLHALLLARAGEADDGG